MNISVCTNLILCTLTPPLFPEMSLNSPPFIFSFFKKDLFFFFYYETKKVPLSTSVPNEIKFGDSGSGAAPLTFPWSMCKHWCRVLTVLARAARWSARSCSSCLRGHELFRKCGTKKKKEAHSHCVAPVGLSVEGGFVLEPQKTVLNLLGWTKHRYRSAALLAARPAHSFNL